MSGCPKCGNLLYVGDIDEEISYIRVVLQCEGMLEGRCDFAETREIYIDDIREHGTLVGGEA